jgi:hypothetical protein
MQYTYYLYIFLQWSFFNMLLVSRTDHTAFWAFVTNINFDQIIKLFWQTENKMFELKKLVWLVSYYGANSLFYS